MQRKYLIIAIFALLIITGIVSAYFITFRKADVSVGNQKADFVTEASLLIDEFENNEQLANEKYLGKIIVVSGEIDDILHDSLSVSLVLKDKDSMAGVICRFDKSLLDSQQLSEGMEVKIKGICTGYLMDVIMNKCVMEE